MPLVWCAPAGLDIGCDAVYPAEGRDLVPMSIIQHLVDGCHRQSSLGKVDNEVVGGVILRFFISLRGAWRKDAAFG